MASYAEAFVFRALLLLASAYITSAIKVKAAITMKLYTVLPAFYVPLQAILTSFR